MTAGERVKAVRKQNGMTMEQFGQRLGVTKMTISKIESGMNGLTSQMARSIAMAFSVSEDWLKDGTGTMRPLTPSGIAAELAVKYGLDATSAGILERFCHLGAAERQMFLQIARRVIVDDPIEEAARAAGEAAEEATRAALMDAQKKKDA